MKNSILCCEVETFLGRFVVTNASLTKIPITKQKQRKIEHCLNAKTREILWAQRGRNVRIVRVTER